MAKMYCLVSLIISTSIYHSTFALDYTNIVFVIMNGLDPYSMKQTEELKYFLRTQITPTITEGEDEDDILICDSTKFRHIAQGDWIYVSALKYLIQEYARTERSWAVFLEPRTRLNYTILLNVLNNVVKNSDLKWIGHADYVNYDNDPFEDNKILGLCTYLPSGFAVNIDAIPLKLKSRASTDIYEPGMELTKRFANQNRHQKLSFHANPYFCGRNFDRKRCATYPTHFKPCSDPVPNASIYFAVSTNKKYHKTRVATIKKTWGNDVAIGFYSDVTDPKIPTISTSAETKGNEDLCEKIKAILGIAVAYAEEKRYIKWIFLAKDDLVIRLQELLSCHDQDHEDMTIIGSVYQVVRESNGKIVTHDHLATEGGAVFSVSAARSMSQCKCDEQSDRFLGTCASDLGIPLINSPLFYYNTFKYYRYREPIEFKPLSFPDDVNPEKTYYKLKLGWFLPKYMPYFRSLEHKSLNEPTNGLTSL